MNGSRDSRIEIGRRLSELIISEYIEGSSNNKAIEIYNGSNDAIDLESYLLRFYFQGKSTPKTSIQLEGGIAPGDVHIVAHEASDPVLLDLADQTDSKAWFNGNDAVELVYLHSVNALSPDLVLDPALDPVLSSRRAEPEVQVLDAVGQIGYDPGESWGALPTSTRNCTLRRRPEVWYGDQQVIDSFDPEEQWLGFPIDDYSGLGWHHRETASDDSEATGIPLSIHDVQSSHHRSPYVGAWVRVEGIVVGTFLGLDHVGGFFVQEQDSEIDGDVETSEGIFVSDRFADVRPGDRVEVVAKVNERFERTTLESARVVVLSRSNPLPAAAILRMPFAQERVPERVEGMRVFLPQTLTLSATKDLGRYGQILVSAGRLRQPTNDVRPGPEAQERQLINDRNRLWIDDGSIRKYPNPIVFPGFELGTENPLRSGYQVSGALGILDHNFGAYRLLLTDSLTISPEENRRSMGPELKKTPLRVASYNAFNYFNGDGQGGQFPTTRGARSYHEFLRQRKKTLAAILALDADVIALMEIENDGYGSDSAIADLVDGLNESVGPQGYAFIDPGYKTIGDDEIAVAIIYRPRKVFPYSITAILNSSVDSRFNDRKNRPSLAQSFSDIATGQRFTIVANHFKSKGSSCDDIGDPNLEDGQGNCPMTRTQAAQALIDWIDTDPTASGDPDYVVMGDFNAYAKEDPISEMLAAGYRDQIDRFVGSERAYSYVFNGQAGSLDHVLASPSMSTQVVDAGHWHSNADEPMVLDYRAIFKSEAQLFSYFVPDAFRASDHDPVIIAIDLKSSVEN